MSDGIEVEQIMESRPKKVKRQQDICLINSGQIWGFNLLPRVCRTSSHKAKQLTKLKAPRAMLKKTSKSAGLSETATEHSNNLSQIYAIFESHFARV